MNASANRARRAATLSTLCLLVSACATGPDPTRAAHALAGTWTLVAADAIQPDNSRVRDYGEAPKGLLIIDAAGNYSLQIFKSERLRFASGNKIVASADEYASAALGSSTHFGSIAVDPAARTLTFSIAGASFPNWEGTRQTRPFELKDDVLSYRVLARPDGAVPISVWKRSTGR